MSILTKPYELSVWTNEWDSIQNKFIEKRLGIIGSDIMDTLNRAIVPNLTRNINGTKKLTFQMYKRYKDTITGEDVINPFIDWLVSEQKVKLKYGTYIDEDGEEQDCWYDFIIKNINENSSNYLCTYQLEDAFVQELSKNGFGVILDEKVRDENGKSNIGTAQELAVQVLKETDWKVESEAFVQTVEEGLVYVNIPAGTYYHISDQEDLRTGVSATETTLPASVGLAFYSCCKNKPHRFQFIYLPEDKNNYNKEGISTDSRGIINEANCQYYIDIDVIESTNATIGYKAQGSFFLPAGWTVVNNPAAIDKNEKNDTTISSWYRGKRYGFAQSAEYIPLLERYCNVYKKGGEEYYGYVDNEYTSPALVQNVITNTEFKGTSGWVGTYSGPTGNVKSSVGAKVESVYGRFSDKGFISVIDDLSNGTYNEDIEDYTAYLKVVFPAKQADNYPVLLNTGFYDNRTLIKNVSSGDQWCFGYEFLNSSGTPITSGFSFVMQEVSYNPDRGNYNRGEEWATIEDGDMVFKNGAISDEEFKEKEVKLVIVPTTNDEQTIYIKNMCLYRKVLNDKDKIIIPGEVDTKGVIDTKYYLFAKSQLDKVENAEQLVYDVVNVLDYGTYVPVYNTGAEKVRSVTAKESNYFNILQSIAETFECWIDFKIKRNRLGAIEEKIVYLKNYIGKNNYACFRYGVNLKDIQRTYESKNIVTKLIVKQNSNEHGKNGFCTIARAGSNPTGENYIYDFSYFHNMGVLNAQEYLGCVYYDTNPFDESIKQTGPDLGPGHETEGYNLQNYFNRIKNINEKLTPIGEELAGLQTDLAKYSAELKVQEGLRDAAKNNLEETVDNFLALTGLLPTQISTESMKTITCEVPAATVDLTGSNALNSGKDWAQDATITKEQIGLANSTTWKFGITLSDTLDNVKEGYELGTLGGTNWDKATGNLVCNAQYSGLTIVPKTKVEGSDEYTYLENSRYELSYKLQKSTNGGTLVCVGSHDQSFRNTEIWFDGIKTDSNIIYIDDDMKEHTVKIVGTFFNNGDDYTPKLCIQPNRGSTEVVSCIITDIELKKYSKNTSSTERSFYFQPKFELITVDGTTTTNEKLISCTIPADSHTATLNYSLAIVDTTATSVASLLTEYATYKSEYNKAIASIGNFDETTQTGLMYAVESQKKAIENKIAERQKWLDHKIALNKLFFTKYSRFIQEGTWISEEHVDDDKYYVDAQSVMYGSCYPQVAYSINVLSLSGLPGYEHFDFEVGDKTFVEDYEFFGEDNKEEVVIAEMSENLDDPSKNAIKVQNFKNQFQDLFQKITATVQQAHYSTGSYEKAVALAEADSAIKGKFVADGLERYGQKLGVAGQTTVIQDESGITLTDSATKDQMRLIGGAIMMSVEDKETGQRSWKTGLTPEGISASRIYAGTLNAGKIQIMNVNEPVFRWDAYGLSAFDANWQNGTISTPNPYKFVRYDKYGIYGINFNKTDEGAVSGTSWKPSSIDEIDRKATFALTWDGLKVTGSAGGTARLGKQKGYIMLVKNSDGTGTFGITEDGKIQTTGIEITSGTIGGQNLASTNYADQVANTAKTEVINKTEQLISGCIKTNDLSITESTDSKTGIKTTTTVYNGVTTTTYTAPSGRYLLTNVGVSGISGGLARYFQVSSDGLLQANNAIIHGAIYANDGYIGGWHISQTGTSASDYQGSLIYGDFATENGFHMYSKGYTTNDASNSKKYFGQSTNKTWALGIGKYFGVTSNGEVYATAGKIGTMEIGQLVGRANQVVGKNLLKGSSEYREASAYALTPATDDWYVYLENLSAPLKANVTYTIACVTDGLWSGHTTSGPGRDRFCTLWLRDSKGNHTCFSGNTTETGYKSWTYTPTADDTYVIRVNAYGKGNSTVKFWDFKIEKGTIATDWCAADEDAMQASVSNDFSWKFSPTEGMFMWNGQQPTNPTNGKTKDAIFAIYDNRAAGATVPKYELSLRGHIEAESGNIGGWAIKESFLVSEDVDLSNKHIVVGGYEAHKWGLLAGLEHQSNTIYNFNFGVDYSGGVHCRKLAVYGGDISLQTKSGHIVALGESFSDFTISTPNYSSADVTAGACIRMDNTQFFYDNKRNGSTVTPIGFSCTEGGKYSHQLHGDWTIGSCDYSNGDSEVSGWQFKNGEVTFKNTTYEGIYICNTQTVTVNEIYEYEDYYTLYITPRGIKRTVTNNYDGPITTQYWPE